MSFTSVLIREKQSGGGKGKIKDTLLAAATLISGQINPEFPDSADMAGKLVRGTLTSI